MRICNLYVFVDVISEYICLILYLVVISEYKISITLYVDAIRVYHLYV